MMTFRIIRPLLTCTVVLCARCCLADNTIAEVRSAADGAHVALSGKVVSARLWGDRLYVVEPNGSCGIGVLNATVVSPGQVVAIDGYKTTQHGEPYIGTATVTPTSSTSAPEPVGLSSRSFFSGPSKLGLPVKVWGAVASGLLSDTLGSYFSVSDGGHDEMRIYVGNTGAVPPGVGITVTVKGIGGINESLPVVLLEISANVQTYFGTIDPSEPPEWVWSANGVARVALDLNAVTAACADGADVIEVPVQDTWYAFYPSSVATSGGMHGDGLLLQQIIGYAHSQGVEVIGAMPACKDASCLTAHTDWRQWPTDSNTWLTKPADQVTGCLVSPYGDYLAAEVEEMARTVGLDGVSMQGYSNTQAFCYCGYCKAAYLAETGASIPATVNFDDSNFRRYLAWHDARITQHLEAMRLRIRLANPQFGVFAWSANAGEYGHYSAAPRIAPTVLNSLFDCAMQRAWYDDANAGLSIAPTFGLMYMNGLTRHRPWIAEADYTTHSADSAAGVSGSSMPEAEVQFRMLSTLASGGKFSFGSTQKQYLRASLFAAASAREPWTYRAEPMKWAAMLVSETTRQYYGRSDAVNKYMKSCFGFLRMMLAEHLPVDIITEADLEAGRAAGYKVLILPGTACLSSASASAIRSFVSAHGGLVATGVASLYDDQGAARNNFYLYDLLKVSKTSAPANLECLVSVPSTLYNRNAEALSELLTPSGHVTSFMGDVVPTSLLAGGISMATICSDLACSTTYPLYVNSPNPTGGRVAYFPAAIDAAFYHYPYPYQAVLLRDAVTWAANSTAPVTVNGPKSLQATYFTQNNGKRIVIHLLNTTNSRAGHANPAGNVPVRTEVCPLYDIEVWFENAVPTSAKLQPENLSLPIDVQGSRARVLVGEFQQHSMVVADIP